jgi:uncharacterized membrane protein
VALLLVLLVVLSLAEELTVGWLHGRALAQTLAEIGQHSWLQVLAGAVLMLLVLLPLVTAKEISDALEPGALRQLLLSASERRPGAPGYESTRA